MKLWPRSLYGRLVIILVSGMLAAQLLTSSIWYDLRHTQVLEIPTRVLASRLGDVLALAHRNPAAMERFMETLESPDFRLSFSAPQRLPSGDDNLRLATESLMKRVIAERTGLNADLDLQGIELLDDQGREAKLATLLGTDTARGHFWVALALPDGRTLHVEARERQGWTTMTPVEVLLDILWRVYLLRILVVAILVLISVRLAIRPLRQLASAAEALGTDIHRPPLPLGGPLEVDRAAQAFNVMQRQLIDHLSDRTRFLASVSHDLRTPITRMRIRAEMLPDESSRARFRSDLAEMEAMVSATLDYVRSGEHRESQEQIDLNALLDGLQADFQDLGAHVEVEGKAHHPLPGYPQTLRRCLQNLIDNAIRYGERAQVLVEDSDTNLCIVIMDHGAGLPEEAYDQVLQPFFRLEDSRNSDTGGYGLGLSIAQGIIDAHGGSLELGRAPTGGLQVTLTFGREATAYPVQPGKARPLP